MPPMSGQGALAFIMLVLTAQIASYWGLLMFLNAPDTDTRRRGEALIIIGGLIIMCAYTFTAAKALTQWVGQLGALL